MLRALMDRECRKCDRRPRPAATQIEAALMQAGFGIAGIASSRKTGQSPRLAAQALYDDGSDPVGQAGTERHPRGGAVNRRPANFARPRGSQSGTLLPRYFMYMRRDGAVERAGAGSAGASV